MRPAAALVLLVAAVAGRALGVRRVREKPSATSQASLLQLDADGGGSSLSTWGTRLREPHLRYDESSRQTGPLVDLAGLIGALIEMIVSAACWAVLVAAVAFFYLRLKELPRPALDGGAATPEGKASDESLSQWKDGLCDCFDEPEICFWACCCPAIRWADTVDLGGLVPFWVALAIYLGLSVGSAFLGEALLWAALAVACAGFRQEMRRKFGMSQSGRTYAEDCLLYCCCSCCAIAQEARHIEEACRVGHPVVVEALGSRRAEAAGRGAPIVLGPVDVAAPPPAHRALEARELRVLESPEEVWELLSGKRVLHVKGFGSGFGDPPEEQMGVQKQQSDSAVQAIKRFCPDYLVVDGDPWGSGFQRYIKAYAQKQASDGLEVPELLWVKNVSGSSPSPEERKKRLGQAREWADQGLPVVVSWLPEATISEGVDRLFGEGCWEKLQVHKYDFRGAVRLLDAAEPDRPEWLRGLTGTAPGREIHLAIQVVESRASMRHFEKCSFENAAKGNAIYQHLRGEGREPAAQGAVSFGGGESVLLEFATLYLFPGSGFDAGQAALLPFSRGRLSDPALPAHEGRAFKSEDQLRVEEEARQVVHAYYAAIDKRKLAEMLACVSDDVTVTFQESHRNWSGREAAEQKFGAWLSSGSITAEDLSLGVAVERCQACGSAPKATAVRVELTCDFGQGPRRMGYQVVRGKIVSIDHLPT